jgi:peptidyl-prolyl cis-trans isomerase A (cyclophilin A)
MHISFRSIISCVALSSCLLLFTDFASCAQPNLRCLIKTSLGDIKVELYPQRAPVTVANFLKYVDKQLYDGSSFYRTCTSNNEAKRKIKIEVIQGGIQDDTKQLDSITIETTSSTKLHHLTGTLSMARSSPNSATSHFFICVSDQPELDFGGKRNPDGFGFAAFGKVIVGMDVVIAIHQRKENNQYLIEPITIYSIRRID